MFVTVCAVLCVLSRPVWSYMLKNPFLYARPEAWLLWETLLLLVVWSTGRRVVIIV